MTRELPLNPLWESYGATFKEIDGWRVPFYFASPDDDYHAAHHSHALIDYSFFGKIRVMGKDRMTVLHNILTQDIKSMPVGKISQAALLSAQGKILMYMAVLIMSDAVMLVVEPGMEHKTMDLIQKFIITEEVILEEITEDYVFLIHSFQGTGGIKNFDGWLIPKDAARIMAEKMLRENLPGKMVPMGHHAAEILRIENGALRYGVDMNEDTLLSETGLEKFSVSATKGCYPGQEVVARIETYGGLHRKVMGLIIESAETPARGSKIMLEEQEIGWITSSKFSPRLKKVVALGYLAKGFFETEQSVEIKSDYYRWKAKTCELPLV